MSDISDWYLNASLNFIYHFVKFGIFYWSNLFLHLWGSTVWAFSSIS